MADLDTYERERVQYPPRLIEWYETVIDVWWEDPQPIELPLLWTKGSERYWVERVEGNIVRLVKLSSRRIKQHTPKRKKRKQPQKRSVPDVLYWDAV